MNIAVIFAGGTGSRMNTKSKPKQFLEVHGKPVLIYTLENFQNHPLIDAIILVCLKQWIPHARKLIEKFTIDKVAEVVPGGRTGQESIYNGLETASKLFDGNSTILIHDGVRPLINEDTITRCIKTVKQYGNAITVSPAIETVLLKEDSDNKIGKILNRSQCLVAKAPQCFILREILEAHQKALSENKRDFIDSASLMQYYGSNLYSVEGPSENIKITTPADFYIFRAIMDARESFQILGL
jgi:2-C-methyl-D-erythritol 4-phosphate cytidylyltransferase